MSILLTMELPIINFPELDSPPSDLQRMIADFYDRLSPVIEELKKKAYADDVFGESICGYFTLLDIEFLLVYLILLNRKLELTRQGSECTILTTAEKKAIIQEWALECIRKTFLCKGARVDKAIKLDILPAFRAFDVEKYTGDIGIGYMFIEGPETEGCEDKETFFIS